MKFRLAVEIPVVAATVLMLAGCQTSGPQENPNPGAIEKTKPKPSPTEAAQINYELGSQYLRQGNFKRARERLERAIDQDPKLPGPHMAMALIFNQTGETRRADSAYRQALKVAPDDANVQNSYAVFLCNRGEHAEGQKIFLQAAANEKNTSPEVAFSNAGVCALAVPDQAAAEAHFRKALKRNPKFSDALLQMASLSYQQAEYLKARAFLERFEANTSMTAEALLLAVRIEKSNGDRRSRDGYAELLRTRFPDSAETRELNGVLNGG